MKALIIIANLFFLTIYNGTINSDQEISTVVDVFFKNRQQNTFETLDRSLLTQDLSNLIEKAIAKTRLEEDKVKGSTNMPLCLEGDIFSSLYEGWDTFEISKIKTKQNKAIVTVQFKFTLNGHKEIWKDEVVLIKEKDWKIDNVIFKARKDGRNTKEELRSFIYSNN